MTVEELLKDKGLKIKAKVTQIGNWLLDGSLEVDELLALAEKLSGSDKANCMEAIEYATKKDKEVAHEALLLFVTKTLKDKEPRIKWESAKVIGNIAALFPEKLKPVIKELLANTEHDGTVVRWATAFALGEILKLKSSHNKTLLPIIEKLSIKEKENGVKKKYLEALKKIKK